MVVEEIEKFLTEIKEKFNDLQVSESIKGITKTVQFFIKDLGLKYTFMVEDGKLKEVIKGEYESPDITIILKSEILLKIIRGESDPVREFMLGRIKVKGSLRDLLKFRKILER